MRPGITGGRAIEALAKGAVPGMCPSCGRASMFRTWIDLYERCPVCGLRYAPESGAWLGAIVVGYGIGALFVLLLVFIEVFAHPIRAIGLNPIWTITLAGLVVTALVYRPSKGLWFALLWVYGFTQDESGAPPGER
jgi:uncharacterized protein (DUF983 family)